MAVYIEGGGGGGVTFLKGEVERNRQPKSARAACISKATWQLTYWRTAIQRAGREITREVRNARREFQRVIQADRQQRVQVAGANIEGYMESGRFK